ncbi:RNA-directed DNA polymerase (Reverse transcriptase), Ribonuclease H, putative, partial [Theobroma cacao]
MDVIRLITPKASNGHGFILVAIDYFTKWVEAVSYFNVRQNAVCRFIQREIICRYGLPKRIITNNVSNLNSAMVNEVCVKFKIKHHNSTTYRLKMNGAVEAANKNIKKIDLMAVLHIEEVSPNELNPWKVYFDGASNALGHGIGAVLISPNGKYYPATARLNFNCTNNMAEYEALVLGLQAAIDIKADAIDVYGDSALVICQMKGEWETRDPKLVPYKKLLKLNPAKCTFGVTSGKLLGFIVSEKGIEVDPDKIRAIQELPPPKTQKEVRGFLGRLNYIARFISQLTCKCDPIFKLLRKRDPGEWNEECQIAFDKIKEYLTNPPVLMPPTVEKPLILYLTVNRNSMGCVLGQHDETGKKERAVYYLSKKFMEYESKYSALEKMCCELAWTAQRLRQYMLYHTTWLVAKLDPIKYIFEKPCLSGRIARWQMLLSEYDIVYVSQKSIKGSAIADFLADRANEDYESVSFDFPDED